MYRHNEVSEEALREVFEGFPVIFTDEMNVTLTKIIMERELAAAATVMAKGKALGHDGIPMEFFKQLWPTIGNEYLQMLLRGIANKELHTGVTKGHISS